MTLAENANRPNYQQVVDQLYQTSDFDFVGIAYKVRNRPIRLLGNTLPEIKVSSFVTSYYVVGLALPD
ncbi:hypothetical protein [Lactiplantibacillus pentosus]|uniref:hypothetical protein n=1 Tax=Lactiplantibacillus pentosus TaxID=1589 RepID=UPI001FFCABE5|nr:hypothetical protein [Lactiplantibacillus pentosus]